VFDVGKDYLPALLVFSPVLSSSEKKERAIPHGSEEEAEEEEGL
jgi:hypothetical protein